MISFLACKPQQAITINSADVKLKIQPVQFKYLTAKGKISYQDQRQNFKSAVEVRMKQDSIIWASFRPILGVEAARVKITQDSVWIYDRINREQRAYDFRTLSRMVKFDLNFQIFQAVLVGNMPFAINSSAKISKEKESFLIEQNQGSIALRHLVSILNNKLTEVKAVDSVTSHQLQVTYTNFINVEKQLFPSLGKATLQYLADNQQPMFINLEIDVQKIELSKTPLRFPF
jgi:hypothetical protein